MVRYFLTDLRGNPIYSFAQRFQLRRGNTNNNNNNNNNNNAVANNNNNNNNHIPPPLHQHAAAQLRNRLLQHHSVIHNDNDDDATTTGIGDADDIDVRTDGTTAKGSGKSNSSPLPLTPQPLLQQQQQLYHVTNFSSQSMVCSIRNQQWEDVMKRIASHPHEIYMIDTTTGNTMLHTACRYNPPSMIIEGLSHAVTIRSSNYDGTTPLHIAVTHKCSKHALQTLFDCCRLMHNKNQNHAHTAATTTKMNDTDHKYNDYTDVEQQQQQQHTSPTADLSRIGRAPIHYACMSFRGLDLEAFQLLLNETLQYGNIWVNEHTTTTATSLDEHYHDTSDPYHRRNEEEEEMEFDADFELNSICGGKGMMDVLDENEVYGRESRDDDDDNNDDIHDHNTNKNKNCVLLYEFENEVDQDLYQLQYGPGHGTGGGFKSSSSSVDNDALTLGDRTHNHHSLINGSTNSNTKKVLVNVMGMKDATGQTPIGLLFKRYRERVKCVITTVDKIRSVPNNNSNTNNNSNNCNKAALVAAIQVHADLGELWERARWIISRLTEERLLREQNEKTTTTMTNNAESTTTTPTTTTTMTTSNNDDDVNAQQQMQHIDRSSSVSQYTLRSGVDATSRRTSYFGGSKSVVKVKPSSYSAKKLLRTCGSIGSDYYYNNYNNDGEDDDDDTEPPSPVAREAASWACELHPPSHSLNDPLMSTMVLPYAPDISTSATKYSMTVSKKSLRPKRNNKLSNTNNNFRIVHASVGLTGYGCPPELIRLAISIHPNQVMEMDQDGNLPIHIAVTAASYLAYTNPIDIDNNDNTTTTKAAAAAAVGSYMANHFGSNNASGYSNNSGDDHSSVISDAALSFFSTATVSQTTNPFDQVIKILLQQYPDSARVPQGKTGRLPLVLAIEESKIGRRRTWNDGIRTLLHAYPPALHNKKIIEPILYPHVLSLVANNNNNNNVNSTTPLQQTSANTSPHGESHRAFDFSGYVDILPNNINGNNRSHPVNASTNHVPQYRRNTNKTTTTTLNKSKKSQRTIRQELCCRTTLYELLRSKPDWLTLGLVDQN